LSSAARQLVRVQAQEQPQRSAGLQQQALVSQLPMVAPLLSQPRTALPKRPLKPLPSRPALLRCTRSPMGRVVSTFLHRPALS
jgi:hypothetical protein